MLIASIRIHYGSSYTPKGWLSQSVSTSSSLISMIGDLKVHAVAARPEIDNLHPGRNGDCPRLVDWNVHE